MVRILFFKSCNMVLLLALVVYLFHLASADLLARVFFGSSTKRLGKDSGPTEYKLLVILADGWRWDYIINEPSLKGFNRLAKSGVKAEYVKPIFPSSDYPNWYTVVTGLYPENHGVVHNYMYDKDRDEFFMKGTQPGDLNSHWWDKAEPIWVTAEKNGVKSALYGWSGCEIEIRGVRPSFCKSYDISKSTLKQHHQELKRNLNDAINRLSKGTIQLAVVYHNGVDTAGHKYGPNAKETKEVIKDFDFALFELQDNILKKELQQELNLVVLSDHGMTNAPEDSDRIISLEKYISLNDISYVLDKGSFVMIQTESGKTEKVYQDLKRANIKGLLVYRKEDLSEKYGIRGNKLVLPIILLAEEGYVIEPISDSVKQKGDLFSTAGNHGYDPSVVKDMWTIFYAKGPLLRRDYTAPGFSMVDHYNLLCYLASVPPRPNNGSWEHVGHMLAEEEQITIWDWIVTGGAVVTIMVAGLYLFVYLSWPKKSRSGQKHE